MADLDIQTYLFKSEYTAEEMQQSKAAAALAEQEDIGGREHPDPELLLTASSDRQCSDCSQMTETPSFCGNESQCGQFLLDANTNP